MGDLRGAAQEEALAGLTSEPPNPLHVVTAAPETAALSEAGTPADAVLLGRALHALDVRPVAVAAPLSEATPLALHLRWDLPLMRVLG